MKQQVKWYLLFTRTLSSSIHKEKELIRLFHQAECLRFSEKLKLF